MKKLFVLALLLLSVTGGLQAQSLQLPVGVVCNDPPGGDVIGATFCDSVQATYSARWLSSLDEGKAAFTVWIVTVPVTVEGRSSGSAVSAVLTEIVWLSIDDSPIYVFREQWTVTIGNQPEYQAEMFVNAVDRQILLRSEQVHSVVSEDGEYWCEQSVARTRLLDLVCSKRKG